MKLLCFQAKRFWWKTFEKTLPEAADQDVEAEVRDAVVAFVHVEAADVDAERDASVFRQTLKHLKWLANKRGAAHRRPAFLHPPRRRERRRRPPRRIFSNACAPA